MASRNKHRRWKQEQKFMNKVAMMRHQSEVFELAVLEMHFHQMVERCKAQELIFKRQKQGREYVV